ncbi:MAG: hypothetical protein ACLQBA_21075 [Candidatus Binataceae bacterium]
MSGDRVSAPDRKGHAVTNEPYVPAGRLVLGMLVFLAIGAPIVLYDWRTLDEVLAGVFQPVPILLASGFAVVFLLGAVLLGRYIRGLVKLND